MRKLAGLALAVLSITPLAVHAGADGPPDAPPPDAVASEPPMPAADGVDPALTGDGALREARVVTDGDGVYRLALRGERGWSRHSLGDEIMEGTGTSYLLEGLELVDLIGDAEPELRLEYSSDRDPCGCDGGPTFASRYVIVCTATRNGPRCSAPIEVARRDHALELEAFTGELVITRGGLARVVLRDWQGVSRRQRAALARPRRLFR